MKLLIVLLVVGLIQTSPGIWSVFRTPFRQILTASSFAILNRLGRTRRYLLATLLIILLAATAYLQYRLVVMAHTWPWFVFSLVGLVLLWGGRDLDADVRRFVDAPDEESAARAAIPLLHSYRKPIGDPQSDAVVRGVFYQSLVRWFGVMFWFLIGGVAGALAFRLPHLFLEERDGLSPRQVGMLKTFASTMDLVPAIIVTISLAVVGHFDAVISAWKRTMTGTHRSPLAIDLEFLPEVGAQVVCSQPDSNCPPANTLKGVQDNVATARNLVWRSLIAWLTVLAIMVLVGVVS